MTLSQERENNLEQNNAELERLRVLIEEKDKHINDLMETLNNFHVSKKLIIQ